MSFCNVLPRFCKISSNVSHKLKSVCDTDLDKLNLVKLDYGGSVLGINQFSILLQQPLKNTFASYLSSQK